MNRLPTLLLLSALLPALAVASPQPPQTAFERIAADTRSGQLSVIDGLIQRFYASMKPELLAADYRDLSLDGAAPCLTDLLAEIRSNWGQLSGTEKHHVELLTSPFYRAWLGRGGMSWEEGDVDLLRAEERSACFGPDSLMGGLGPFNDAHETENFVVHYTEGGDVTDSKVEDLAGWFEESLAAETSEQGFYWPSNLLNYQMVVIVQRLPSASTGGFTSYEICGLNGYMAFVVVNDQWFEDTERLKSVAAHEFFHAIQIEYALAEMWGNPNTPNRWWIEASAVYMETEVYPDLYNSQLSQALRWIQEPWRSLTTYDDSGYQYGTYLFGASIREELGDPTWFKTLWSQIEGREGYDLIEEFDLLLQDAGTSFAEQYGQFIARGATGDYDFNPYLPGPMDLEALSDGWMDNSVTRDHDRNDLPLSQSVNSSSGLERPEVLGTNYIWFDGGGVADNQGLIVRFDGSGKRHGVDLEWAVRLVAVEDDDPVLTHTMDLTPHEVDGDLDSWTGEVLLNDFGEDFDGLFLVVSPLTDFGNDSVTWGYSAELTTSIADGSFTAVPEENLDPDESGGGCRASLSDSQASSSGTPASLVCLAVVLAWSRRRRVLLG